MSNFIKNFLAEYSKEILFQFLLLAVLLFVATGVFYYLEILNIGHYFRDSAFVINLSRSFRLALKYAVAGYGLALFFYRSIFQNYFGRVTALINKKFSPLEARLIASFVLCELVIAFERVRPIFYIALSDKIVHFNFITYSFTEAVVASLLVLAVFLALLYKIRSRYFKRVIFIGLAVFFVVALNIIKYYQPEDYWSAWERYFQDENALENRNLKYWDMEVLKIQTDELEREYYLATNRRERVDVNWRVALKQVHLVDLKQALFFYRLVEQEDPGFVLAKMMIARTLIAMSRFDEAIRKADECLVITSDEELVYDCYKVKFFSIWYRDGHDEAMNDLENNKIKYRDNIGVQELAELMEIFTIPGRPPNLPIGENPIYLEAEKERKLNYQCDWRYEGKNPMSEEYIYECWLIKARIAYSKFSYYWALDYIDRALARKVGSYQEAIDLSRLIRREQELVTKVEVTPWSLFVDSKKFVSHSDGWDPPMWQF